MQSLTPQIRASSSASCCVQTLGEHRNTRPPRTRPQTLILNRSRSKAASTYRSPPPTNVKGEAVPAVSEPCMKGGGCARGFGARKGAVLKPICPPLTVGPPSSQKGGEPHNRAQTPNKSTQDPAGVFAGKGQDRSMDPEALESSPPPPPLPLREDPRTIAKQNQPLAQPLDFRHGIQNTFSADHSSCPTQSITHALCHRSHPIFTVADNQEIVQVVQEYDPSVIHRIVTKASTYRHMTGEKRQPKGRHEKA